MSPQEAVDASIVVIQNTKGFADVYEHLRIEKKEEIQGEFLAFYENQQTTAEEKEGAVLDFVTTFDHLSDEWLLMSETAHQNFRNGILGVTQEISY